MSEKEKETPGKRFTADVARKLCSNYENKLLQDLLILITEEAIKGKRNVYTTAPLNDYVRKELTNRGFSIKSLGSLAAQKDGLYDSIG
jgi:hypothetical protein